LSGNIGRVLKIPIKTYFEINIGCDSVKQTLKVILD